jgi:hypothetical protein
MNANVGTMTLQQMFFQGSSNIETIQGKDSSKAFTTCSPQTECTADSEYSNLYENESDDESIDQICKAYEDDFSDDDNEEEDEVPHISTLYASQQHSRIGISRPSYSSSSDENTILNVNPILEKQNKTLSDNAKQTSNFVDMDSDEDDKVDEDEDEDIDEEHKDFSNDNNPSTPSPNKLQGVILSSVSALQDTNITKALSNERFMSPGQGSKQKGLLVNLSTPSKSRVGLGIAAPPKSPNSNRLLVPSVNPPSPDLFTIFILVIHATKKIYELIRVNYNPATSTIRELIEYMKENISEDRLKEQNYVGLCRPRGSSPSCRSITDMQMTASVMTRNGSDARIHCGEVLSAIPDGYSGKEMQLLTRHILKLPMMKKLLKQVDPLSNSSRRKESNIVDQKEFGNSVMLGIQQPQYDENYSDQNETDVVMNVGAFSSQIIFSSTSPSSSQATNKNSVFNGSEKKTNSYNSGSTSISQDHFKESVASPTNLSRFDPSHFASTKDNDAIRSEEKTRGVSSPELEKLKYEAALAAHQAAEEAFLTKMEQLADSLKCSTDERARLMELSKDFKFPIPNTPRSLPSNVHFRNSSDSPEVSILSGDTPSIPSTPLARDIAGGVEQPPLCKYPYSPIGTFDMNNSNMQSTSTRNGEENQMKSIINKKKQGKKRWGLLKGFRSNR